MFAYYRDLVKIIEKYINNNQNHYIYIQSDLRQNLSEVV